MFGNSPHNEDRGWQSELCRAYLEECVFPKMNGVFLIWQIHKYEKYDNKIKVFTFWKSRKLKQVCKRQWNTNCFSFVVLFQEFHWPIAIILRKHPQVFKNNTVYIFVSPIVKDRFFKKKIAISWPLIKEIKYMWKCLWKTSASDGQRSICWKVCFHFGFETNYNELAVIIIIIP